MAGCRALLTYLQSMYYSYLCDHNQVVKLSASGSTLATQFKCKRARRLLALRFEYNLAVSYFLQHQFASAALHFNKVVI